MSSIKTKINASLSISMGVVFLAVAANTMAAERNSSYVESCKSEVRQHYGANTEVLVVSKRLTFSGLQVKMAARLDRDNTDIVNCWVPGNENGDVGYGRDSNTFVTRLEFASKNLPY